MTYFNRIEEIITFFQMRVHNRNSCNLTDINIYAENFYRDLFAKIESPEIGYTFTNTNFDINNSAHIDLIDTGNKTAIQVTAQNDNNKITETVKGFFENKEHPEYKHYRLKVLLISKKEAKEYRTDFTEKGIYSFDHTLDVIDIPRLLKIIENRHDNLEQIAKFLESRNIIPRPKTESNEVETIMSLLEFLSDDKNYIENEKEYECDPEKKIESKLKDYAVFFKDEFMRLYADYYLIIIEAKKAFGIDGVRGRKISNYLIYKSNRSLSEFLNNAELAFNSLTDFFEQKVSENGIKSDVGAIRFYLLEELIGCNIFTSEK